MIKLSIPYCKAFLQKKEEFLKLINTVEVRDHFCIEVPLAKEKIFHLSEGIFNECFIKKIKEGRIKNTLKNNNIRYLSFDFGPGCLKVEEKNTEFGTVYLPLSSPLKTAMITALFKKRMKELRAFFQGDIALETLNYYPTGAYENVCDPDIFRKFITGEGIYLLIDIAHVKVSAHNLGLKPADYLRKLPLKYLKQVHLSRTGLYRKDKLNLKSKRYFVFNPDNNSGSICYDAHGCPGLSEMKLAVDLLRQSKVKEKYITIEYYRDPSKLLNAYKSLEKLLRNG